MAQSCHAAIMFQHEHKELASEWLQQSNYICILEIANEEALSALIIQAEIQAIKFSVFREPDIDNQLTSVAFEPGNKSKKLCNRLKLALSNK